MKAEIYTDALGRRKGMDKEGFLEEDISEV